MTALITDILSRSELDELIAIFNKRKEANHVPEIEIPLQEMESLEALFEHELVSENTGVLGT